MNRPAAVEIAHGCMRFLITHNPTNATLNKFTEVGIEKASLSSFTFAKMLRLKILRWLFRRS